MTEFAMRRLLGEFFGTPPAAANGTMQHAAGNNGGVGSGTASFDTNMVFILAALLCALVFALALNSVVRCALRCGRRVVFENTEEASARLAATGLKKRSLRRIPVAVYGSGADFPATDCPICLSEFADGEKVRVLPRCHHGFHVRNRTKSGQSAGQYPNIRTRALSAPSSLVVAERDALASMEFDDQEEYRSRGPMVKDQHFSNPLPLPLPSPQANSVLKNLGSFKSSNTSGPIAPSGPLPLPPLGGGFRKFSYEEVSCACLHFSADRCISEGTSSTIYKASFSDDTMGLKKTDATVTRACSSLSLETLEKGLLTPKSNVWSFGIVLLELLTGRKNLDNRYPKEERNIVKWSRPFLDDDCRLSLIMDPRIKGRFPSKAARTVADIALKCLQKDPSERPTMRTIVESLENVQDMKYPSRYPLQEPSVKKEPEAAAIKKSPRVAKVLDGGGVAAGRNKSVAFFLSSTAFLSIPTPDRDGIPSIVFPK
ncbi:hypothetical protein BHM03_00014876 [Ensete ventricosum]|nr:hypothetical protein BHM03_00014876 [Ensete ventricosum]